MNMLSMALLSLLAFGAPAEPTDRACSLLSWSQVAAARDDRIVRQQETRTTRGPFAVSRCFFQTTDFHKSVGLELVTGTPLTTRAFWTERFLQFEADGIERTAPRQVPGLGTDAWWTDNGRFGSLYVLLGDRYLAIDLGGSDQPERLALATRLAILALDPLQARTAQVTSGK